jgi:hypothetical protein
MFAFSDCPRQLPVAIEYRPRAFTSRAHRNLARTREPKQTKTNKHSLKSYIATSLHLAVAQENLPFTAALSATLPGSTLRHAPWDMNLCIRKTGSNFQYLRSRGRWKVRRPNAGEKEGYSDRKQKSKRDGSDETPVSSYRVTVRAHVGSARTLAAWLHAAACLTRLQDLRP